jgi:hypothetical protein
MLLTGRYGTEYIRESGGECIGRFGDRCVSKWSVVVNMLGGVVV